MAENLKGKSDDPPSLTSSPTTASPSGQHSNRQESDSPFAVTVGDVYEGPLDLLLDLIRKQQIDIRDIPIARITAQYFEYMEQARQMDIDLGAEFVYMAATLIYIKSKMLLPQDPELAEGAEDDPRQELVDRLLEREKFKN